MRFAGFLLALFASVSAAQPVTCYYAVTAVNAAGKESAYSNEASRTFSDGECAGTLRWIPPTQNDDGSLLTDLAGYRVFWGTSPRDYTKSETISDPAQTSFIVPGGLAPVTYKAPGRPGVSITWREHGLVALRVVELAIQASLVDAALTDFPLLITRANLPNEVVDPSGSNNAQADGGDLRFYSDAGLSTQIPADVVAFEHDSSTNAGDAVVAVWVKVPSVSASVDTSIYMTYNAGSTLSQPAVGDAYGRNAVWADAEIAVLAEDATPVDRSGQHTLTANGTITNGDGGDLGKYNSFADNAYLSNTDAALVNIPTTYDFTVSALVRRAAIAPHGGTPALVAWEGDDDLIMYSHEDNTTAAINDGVRVFWRDLFSSTELPKASDVCVADAWAWIDFTSRAADNHELYVAGTSVDTAADTGSAGPFATFSLGGWLDTQSFIGDIAKLIVWDGARTDAWIAAEHANQSDPDTFLIAGTPSDASGGGEGGVTGSGDAEAQAATVSGTGERSVTASGAPAAQSATTAGTGERSVTASGAPSAQSATTAGTGERSITSSGAAAAQSATVAGSGTVGEAITGTGTAQAQSATVAGTGERSITSTGAAQAQSAQTAGTGERSVTASGAAASQSATTQGTAERSVTGSGDPESQSATVEGIGSISGAIIGTGNAQAQSASVAGTGERTVTSAGAVNAQSATAAGVGERVVTSSGSAVAQSATAEGSGGLEAITGTGNAQAQAASVDGIAEREIVATAEIIALSAVVAGVGERISSRPPATRHIVRVEPETRTVRVPGDRKVRVR